MPEKTLGMCLKPLEATSAYKKYPCAPNTLVKHLLSAPHSSWLSTQKGQAYNYSFLHC